MENADDSKEVEFVGSGHFKVTTARLSQDHWGQPSIQHCNTPPPYTANQQYSTATQLRLMHKKYKRED